MDFTGAKAIPDAKGIIRDILIGNRMISIDSADGKAFLEWNARQPVPLDLSDREPDSARPDPEAAMQQRLIDYLATDPQTVPALQREAALRAVIRLVLRREGRLSEVQGAAGVPK